MIGRGAVADPYLALRIKGLMDEKPSPEDWHALLPHIAEYWDKVHSRVVACHAPGRLKLLLSYFRRTWPAAIELYAAIRTIRDPLEIPHVLAAAASVKT